MRTLLLFFMALSSLASAELQPPQTVPLWHGQAPGALGNNEGDTPSLTIYLPFRDKGAPPVAGVVVFPGGSYRMLADNHEGRQVANWFNSLGLAAFVVHYRLGPRYHHPVELGDAQRAIRLVRYQAREYGIDSRRLGIMGFSAGGHLASTAATHFDNGDPQASDAIDRTGCRPDFLILGYPVISFSTPYTHKGSLQNLLGENPESQLIANLSNELQITPQTPPTFLFHTDADSEVPSENSVLFYLALRKNHVPAELHIFERGEHGVGLALNDPSLSLWPSLLANWLRARGLLN